mmetsp:Transcript_26878/g.43877  ORF Transcript_26878/g.43877 Transcript_26878/m.43877 type:complete len:90 (+) Transcript_26878:774-1043(+)
MTRMMPRLMFTAVRKTTHSFSADTATTPQYFGSGERCVQRRLIFWERSIESYDGTSSIFTSACTTPFERPFGWEHRSSIFFERAENDKL